MCTNAAVSTWTTERKPGNLANSLTRNVERILYFQRRNLNLPGDGTPVDLPDQENSTEDIERVEHLPSSFSAGTKRQTPDTVVNTVAVHRDNLFDKSEC